MSDVNRSEDGYQLGLVGAVELLQLLPTVLWSMVGSYAVQLGTSVPFVFGYDLWGLCVDQRVGSMWGGVGRSW